MSDATTAAPATIAESTDSSFFVLVGSLGGSALLILIVIALACRWLLRYASAEARAERRQQALEALREGQQKLLQSLLETNNAAQQKQQEEDAKNKGQSGGDTGRGGGGGMQNAAEKRAEREREALLERMQRDERRKIAAEHEDIRRLAALQAELQRTGQALFIPGLDDLGGAGGGGEPIITVGDGAVDNDSDSENGGGGGFVSRDASYFQKQELTSLAARNALLPYAAPVGFGLPARVEAHNGEATSLHYARVHSAHWEPAYHFPSYNETAAQRRASSRAAQANNSTTNAAAPATQPAQGGGGVPAASPTPAVSGEGGGGGGSSDSDEYSPGRTRGRFQRGPSMLFVPRPARQESVTVAMSRAARPILLGAAAETGAYRDVALPAVAYDATSDAFTFVPRHDATAPMFPDGRGARGGGMPEANPLSPPAPNNRDGAAGGAQLGDDLIRSIRRQKRRALLGYGGSGSGGENGGSESSDGSEGEAGAAGYDDLLLAVPPDASATDWARAQAHRSFFHSPLDIHNNEVDYRRRGPVAVADATVAPLSQVARYPRSTTDAKLESSRMRPFDSNAYQRGDFL